MAQTKLGRRLKIKLRVRKKVNGTSETPRLSVFRSNKQISVQVIDDLSKKTLASASSLVKELSDKKGNKTVVKIIITFT